MPVRAIPRAGIARFDLERFGLRRRPPTSTNEPSNSYAACGAVNRPMHESFAVGPDTRRRTEPLQTLIAKVRAVMALEASLLSHFVKCVDWRRPSNQIALNLLTAFRGQNIKLFWVSTPSARTRMSSALPRPITAFTTAMDCLFFAMSRTND